MSIDHSRRSFLSLQFTDNAGEKKEQFEKSSESPETGTVPMHRRTFNKLLLLFGLSSLTGLLSACAPTQAKYTHPDAEIQKLLERIASELPLSHETARSMVEKGIFRLKKIEKLIDNIVNQHFRLQDMTAAEFTNYVSNVKLNEIKEAYKEAYQQENLNSYEPGDARCRSTNIPIANAHELFKHVDHNLINKNMSPAEFEKIVARSLATFEEDIIMNYKFQRIGYLREMAQKKVEYDKALFDKAKNLDERLEADLKSITDNDKRDMMNAKLHVLVTKKEYESIFENF